MKTACILMPSHSHRKIRTGNLKHVHPKKPRLPLNSLFFPSISLGASIYNRDLHFSPSTKRPSELSNVDGHEIIGTTESICFALVITSEALRSTFPSPLHIPERSAIPITNSLLQHNAPNEIIDKK